MAEKDRVEQEARDIYNQYYTRQNDPAKAGSDAFRRAVASQLRQSYQQQRETGQTYSDLYQQARRQATRMGAMSDASGFSGGMARGQAARASAAEIQALSNIAAQRESAMRDIMGQRQAIPSNALIEAQQADQYARAIETANRERAAQIFDIVGSVKSYNGLSAKQKAQLRAYGITDAKTFANATTYSMPTQQLADAREAAERGVNRGDISLEGLENLKAQMDKFNEFYGSGTEEEEEEE